MLRLCAVLHRHAAAAPIPDALPTSVGICPPFSVKFFFLYPRGFGRPLSDQPHGVLLFASRQPVRDGFCGGLGAPRPECAAGGHCVARLRFPARIARVATRGLRQILPAGLRSWGPKLVRRFRRAFLARGFISFKRTAQLLVAAPLLPRKPPADHGGVCGVLFARGTFGAGGGPAAHGLAVAAPDSSADPNGHPLVHSLRTAHLAAPALNPRSEERRVG